MEELQTYLAEDETVIISKTEERNDPLEHSKFIIMITFIFSLATIISLAFLLVMATNYSNEELTVEVFGFVLFLLFSFIFGCFLFLTSIVAGSFFGIIEIIDTQIREIIDSKSRMNLSWEELRNYKPFFVITNKRFIKKSFKKNIFKEGSGFSTLSREAFQKIRDIIFIELKSIKVIVVNNQHRMMYISFYLDYTERKQDATFLKLEISVKELETIMKTLKELISIEREQIRSDDIVYYMKED